MRPMGRLRTRIVAAVVLLGSGPPGGAETAPPRVPKAEPLARGVWIVRGGILPNREPDGNSVIFAAPAGLIVMDTGRHDWHVQGILALALEQRKPVIAIVNSRWHPDHVSGNPALRAAYPGLRVYASNAIDGALSGFLPASAAASAADLADPQLPEETRADLRLDIVTIQHGSALRPDVLISAPTTLSRGGRKLRIKLARDAATSGDVWLYDPRSGIAVLGDLVTLPAPFLDPACPEGWKAALAEAGATPFRLAVPGHGAPMQRQQFLLYRRAFESFIDCSNSDRPVPDCATSWANAVQPLLPADPAEMRRAQSMAAYYVGLLRANSGRSQYCQAQPKLKADG